MKAFDNISTPNDTYQYEKTASKVAGSGFVMLGVQHLLASQPFLGIVYVLLGALSFIVNEYYNQVELPDNVRDTLDEAVATVSDEEKHQIALEAAEFARETFEEHTSGEGQTGGKTSSDEPQSLITEEQDESPNSTVLPKNTRTRETVNNPTSIFRDDPENKL